MIIRSLIVMAVLLASLAACTDAVTPLADPVLDEAAIPASEGHWMAAAHTHRFERALAAARE